MDEYEGFTLDDAEIVQRVYVCSQCEGELSIYPTFLDPDLYVIVCLEHGNIERIGRISRTTVAIRNEQDVFQFLPACRALPDLWGYFIPAKREAKVILSELGF